MFNLDTIRNYSRAVAFGAVAISAIAFAGAAKAAPVQLFPFFQPLPPMAAPQPIQPYQPYQATSYQAAPSEDQDAVEMPAPEAARAVVSVFGARRVHRHVQAAAED